MTFDLLRVVCVRVCVRVSVCLCVRVGVRACVFWSPGSTSQMVEGWAVVMITELACVR